jgi:hypothetical protein
MHRRRIATGFVAWHILAIVCVGVAHAATIQEVAHCRAIAQRSKMVACFKALKHRPAKTEDAAHAATEAAKSTKKDERESAETESTGSTNAEGTASSTGERLAPEMGGPVPSKVVPPLASDAPVSTSSINRPNAASDRPLCVDRDALAGTLVAGLLTSDPALAATRGCQALPTDATLQVVERDPGVFSFMRMIAVKVMSPTRPDLTVGFTIEVDPLVSDGSFLKAPQ